MRPATPCCPRCSTSCDSEAATGELERLLTFQRGLLEAADEHDVEQAGQLTAASIDAATERIRQLLPES